MDFIVSQMMTKTKRFKVTIDTFEYTVGNRKGMATHQ